MQVITFYSYRNDTPRSDAAVRAARFLGAAGKRVLIVDWNIQSPGLDRYFPAADRSLDKGGLLEAFDAFDGETFPSLTQMRIPDVAPGVDYLSAGRSLVHDRTYAARACLDWAALHALYPSVFDDFRHALREYDMVIVDAPTGIGPAALVCLMLLPESLVLIVSPEDVGMCAYLTREALSYRGRSSDPRPLTVYPMPTHVPDRDVRSAFEHAFQDGYSLTPEEADLRPWFDRAWVDPDYVAHCLLTGTEACDGGRVSVE